MKKYLSLFLALCLMLICFTGCGANKEAEANVTGLITTAFTAPDRILMANRPIYALSTAYDEAKVMEGDVEKYEARFEELYGPYCNENLLSGLSSTADSAQVWCETSGKICTVDNIKLEAADNNYYNFTATVHYGLKDASENSFELAGKAQVDEDNKVSLFYVSTREIYQLLQ